MSDQNYPDDGPRHSASSASAVTSGVVLSDKWYARLKWFTLIFLPAFSGLYFSLAAVWEQLPAAEQVVGTSAIFATFLGLLLGVSSQNFNKQGADGSINAQVKGDQVVLSRISLPNIAPEELAKKKSITIQVNPTSGLSQ
jgi:hypothetical protein